MIRFLRKRIIEGLMTIIGVIALVYTLFFWFPGSAEKILDGRRSDIMSRSQVIDHYRLHKPPLLQLIDFYNDLSPFSAHRNTEDNLKKYEPLLRLSFHKSFVCLKRPYLGKSFQSGEEVAAIIGRAITTTLVLVTVSILLATFFGAGFGILSALHYDKWFDKMMVMLSIAGMSVPSFISSLLLALFFGFYLGDITGLNITGQLWEIHPLRGREFHPENIILPSLSLSLRPYAMIFRVTREAMHSIMQQQYIRAASARGLSQYQVIFGHAIRNAVNPLITTVTGWFSSLLAGTFFVEYIFDLKGLGFITIVAIQNQDFPVIMGAIIIIAVIFIAVSMIAELLYGIVDPRIRLAQ